MAKSTKKQVKKAAKKVAKKQVKKSPPKKAPAKKKAAKPVSKAVSKKAKVVSKKASPKKAAPKKAVAKKPARKPNAAFMTALTLSDALAKVVGSQSLPRTEIIKRIWIYIKKNNLQDKTNKRMINADEALKPIFVKDQISMFEMAGALNKHVK